MDNDEQRWFYEVDRQQIEDNEMSIKEIASALVKAKAAFDPALKDSTNPHFKSKYADLGNCINAVDGALLANGIFMYQEPFCDNDGISIETVFLHQSGETLRAGKVFVPASKKDAQGYGSALTYARRYSLVTACGIAAEDDDGNAATASNKQKVKPQSKKDDPKSIDDVRRVELIAALEGSTTLDQLRANFALAQDEAKKAGDSVALQDFIATKDTLKAKFESDE